MPALAALGLLAYVALAGFNIWLWEKQGIIAANLIGWEAARRVLVGVDPPDMAVLLSSEPASLYYLVLLSGAAFNAAALLGALAVVLVAARLQRTAAPAWLLPLIILQPAFVLAALYYPALLLHSLLFTATLRSVLRYLRTAEHVWLLTTALLLAVTALTGPPEWWLWLSLGLILTVRARTWAELLSLFLVLLFPALFISQTLGLLRRDLVPLWLPAVAPAPHDVPLVFWVGVPLVYLLLLVSLCYRRPATTQHAHVRLRLVLALPLIAAGIVLSDTTAHVYDLAPQWQVLVPLLLLLPVLWSAAPQRRRRRLALVVGLLLAASLALGWVGVLRTPSEANTLLAPVLPATAPAAPHSQLAGLRAAVARLNAELQPGQRVLASSSIQMPLVAWLDDPAALFLPHQLDYTVALQQPADWADYLVLTAPRAGGPTLLWGRDRTQLLAGYRLIQEHDAIQVYQRSADE